MGYEVFQEERRFLVDVASVEEIRDLTYKLKTGNEADERQNPDNDLGTCHIGVATSCENCRTPRYR